jgi:thiol-disulfide isomerase/thioredoxin
MKFKILLVIPMFLVGNSLCQERKDTVEVGTKAPLFSLREIFTNKEIRLDNLIGKVLKTPKKNKIRQVVVLDFWSTWCKPCQIEIPYLQKLYMDFKGNPLKVFLVNTLEQSTVRTDSIKRVIKQRGYTLSCLVDTNNIVARMYGVRGLPRLFVIDKAGIVREITRGYHEGFEKDLAILIKKLVNE